MRRPSSSRSAGIRTRLSRGALFVLGLGAPYLLLCVYLASLGVFENFWFWTVTYASAYVRVVPLEAAPVLFFDNAVRVIGPNLPIWVLAIANVVYCWSRGGDRKLSRFLAAFLTFSFLAVCPGFYFRPHYFIVLLPALSLAAGSGIVALLHSIRDRNRARLAGRLWVLAHTLAFAVSVALQGDNLLLRDATAVSRDAYGRNPFPESLHVARYIRENSSPSDRVAVLGSEPQIYFYSDRRSATRYVYAYALMEPHPHSRDLQRQVMREIETTKPLFVVLVRVEASWMVLPGSAQDVFRWMETYLPAHYDAIGLVEIPTDGPTRYAWGSEVAGRAPETVESVVIFRRRDRSDRGTRH